MLQYTLCLFSHSHSPQYQNFCQQQVPPISFKVRGAVYSMGKQQAQLPRISVTKMLPAVRCQVNKSLRLLPASLPSHPHNANNSQYLLQVPQRLLSRFTGDGPLVPRTKPLLHLTLTFWFIRKLCCTAVLGAAIKYML